MKKQITRSNERMRTQIDWLDSRHSFSFGGHYDPQRMGFGPLRVVNDDHVAPGGGFPLHLHQDMEIVSIVLEGQLAHEDSLGNGRVIETGDIQYMSAGSGIKHSEFNPSKDQPVHFMQIWLQPNAKGLAPLYADRELMPAQANQWQLVLAPDGEGGAIAVRQDATLRSLRLDAGVEVVHPPVGLGRGLWFFVIEGAVRVASEDLQAGDSLALSELAGDSTVTGVASPARLLVFDLPL
jgi:redox-sensitive bicupin YhaK (pirin superfamily)